MTTYNVAVLGATGAVGQELISILLERGFPIKSLKALASARSAGRVLEIGEERLVVEEVAPESFIGIDLAFFMAGASVSRQFAQVAQDKGVVVIDNSSAFRMDADVPLVVPEVNPKDALDRPRNVIANPNCTTIQMVVALKAIEQLSSDRCIYRKRLYKRGDEDVQRNA